VLSLQATVRNLVHIHQSTMGATLFGWYPHRARAQGRSSTSPSVCKNWLQNCVEQTLWPAAGPPVRAAFKLQNSELRALLQHVLHGNVGLKHTTGGHVWKLVLHRLHALLCDDIACNGVGRYWRLRDLQPPRPESYGQASLPRRSAHSTNGQRAHVPTNFGLALHVDARGGEGTRMAHSHDSAITSSSPVVLKRTRTLLTPAC
jgi:hypothetical protein